jgi:Tol biopolymer transport system component
LILKTPTSIGTTANATTTDQTLFGFALPGNISSVSVLGETIFYLQTYSGLSQGFTSTFDGKSKKQIWQSPLSDLSAQMVNANSVALTTKPYQNVPGFAYLVSTGSGSVKKLLGNIPGLVTLVSPDATQILYSSQSDAGSQMALYNVKSGSAVAVTPATFPEKCVWSKKVATIVYCAVPENSLNGGSLTAWYMGGISWSDDIWKYDLKQNTASVIERLTNDAGQQIDVVKPALSVSEQYLVFTNKIDGTLWSLDLTK